MEIYKNIDNIERSYLENKLFAYNQSKAPIEYDNWFKEYSYAYKNNNNQVIAGLIGVGYYWNIAFLEVLWVDENYRNQKLGTSLLRTFESELINNNYRILQLQSFSFQAPNFYEKNGYHRNEEIYDSPPGHSLIFYHKFLTGQKR